MQKCQTFIEILKEKIEKTIELELLENTTNKIKIINRIRMKNKTNNKKRIKRTRNKNIK